LERQERNGRPGQGQGDAQRSFRDLGHRLESSKLGGRGLKRFQDVAVSRL